MTCPGKTHFLTVAINVMIARNTKNPIAGDARNLYHFIKEGGRSFVLVRLTGECEVTGRKYKVDSSHSVTMARDVFAHRG